MVFLVGLCAMLNSFMKQNDVFGSALLKGGKENVIPPETSPRALNYFNIHLHPPYLDAELDNFFSFFSNSSTTLQQLLCVTCGEKTEAEPKSCKAPHEPEFKTLCCLMCLKCLCALAAAAVSAPELICTNGISSTEMWQALKIPALTAKCCSQSGQFGSAPKIKCQPKSWTAGHGQHIFYLKRK